MRPITGTAACCGQATIIIVPDVFCDLPFVNPADATVRPARSPSLPLQCSASATLSEGIIGDSTEKMDTGVAELVSFLQALKSDSLFGYLILLALVLTGLALIIVAVAHQRIVIKRFQMASKATQENFATIAADLRKRALEVKKQDDGLRKRDLELKESPQQQRQVLKGSQRAMKGSVSHIVTVGLKDFQNRILQTDFKVMASVVPDRSKADLHTRLACGQVPRSSPRRIHDPLVTSFVGATR
jgi:hypothetical protein